MGSYYKGINQAGYTILPHSCQWSRHVERRAPFPQVFNQHIMANGTSEGSVTQRPVSGRTELNDQDDLCCVGTGRSICQSLKVETRTFVSRTTPEDCYVYNGEMNDCNIWTEFEYGARKDQMEHLYRGRHALPLEPESNPSPQLVARSIGTESESQVRQGIGDMDIATWVKLGSILAIR